MKLGIEELSIIVEGLRLRVKQLSSSVTEINQSIENLETEDGTKAPAIMQTTIPAAIASFSNGGEDMPIKSLKCTIVPVQEGTGDPAPDNVRPITGWDGVNVVRTGKNLLKTTVETYTKNGITLTRNSDGTYHVYGTPTGTADFNLAPSIDLVLGESYILSGCPANGGSNKYKLDLYMSGSPTDYGNGASFTSSASSALPRIVVYEGAGTVDLTFSPMLRLASMSDETYEPYSADSHSLSFPSTVYGGWVDVVKGELHVTQEYADLGDLTWTYYTGGTNPIFISSMVTGMISGVKNAIPDCISEMFTLTASNDRSALAETLQNGQFTLLNGYSAFVIRYDAYTDKDTFKTAMDGVKAVFKLSAEAVYDLDPVTITTLLGYNNVYCDTGTTEVEYAADTKMYIDNAIASVTPEPEPEQDDAPPEEEEEEEAEPAPEEDTAEPEEVEEEEAAEEEEAEPVVKKASRKK